MGRLTLAMAGAGLVVAAVGMLWVVSPMGQAALGGHGAPLQPKELALPFTLAFSLGFLFSVGALTEGMLGKLARLLTGGGAVRVGPAHQAVALPARLAWGLPGYLLMATGFGAFALRSLQQTWDVSGALANGSLLATAGFWPYHLMAALAPWGLTPDKFY